MTRRCLLDLSTLARWTGPPTGMIRVEHELRAATRDGFPNVTPVFYDPVSGNFRMLAPRWADQILGLTARIDGWNMDYTVVRKGWRRVVPSRYPIIRALEGWRLKTDNRILSPACEFLQSAVLSIRHPNASFHTPDGRRIAIVPREQALAEPVTLGADDVIFAVAYDWQHKDLDRIGKAKTDLGFKYVGLCYDIIPLLFPHYFPEDDVKLFKAYWHRMFALADLVIVNSQAVREDIGNYCTANDIVRPRLAVVRLGSKRQQAQAAGPLPESLRLERYALFVSTIEPRKNHGLLLAVWQKLLARGIPQEAGFKLVFVGMAGWMVDEILRSIADETRWNGTLLHLPNVDATTLEALYRDAAFCLYPSYYEGFGLPVVEAYARGKPVICSNGGALREFAHLGPNLNPDDEGAWEHLIEQWMRDPAQRPRPDPGAAFEHRDWDTVARQMIEVALDTVPA